MAQQPFAFGVAQPVHGEATPEHHYDAEAQQTVWEGDSPPLAARCTSACCNIGCQHPSCFINQSCNAYGSYCNTWNLAYAWTGVRCDT